MSMSMFSIAPALESTRRENNSAFPDAPTVAPAAGLTPRRLTSAVLLAIGRSSLALARRIDSTRPLPAAHPAR